jgi:multidrug efflux pump subunit AcrA (membrane-fusion protein)
LQQQTAQPPAKPAPASEPNRALMVAPPRDLSRVEHDNTKPVKMSAEDMDFVAEEQAGMILERKGWVSVTIVAFLVTLIVGVVMAHYTELEEITQGPGRVVPLSKEQVVQSLEGGILKEMLVREGDVVQKGQLLLKLDPTKASSSAREGENRQ